MEIDLLDYCSGVKACSAPLISNLREVLNRPLFNRFLGEVGWSHHLSSSQKSRRADMLISSRATAPVLCEPKSRYIPDARRHGIVTKIFIILVSDNEL